MSSYKESSRSLSHLLMSFLYLLLTHEPYAFTPELQGIAAQLAGTHCVYPRREARLSWPEWLVTYRDKCPSQGIKHGHSRPSQY